jgi:quercetin dioxygenase-like cupin family protein
MGCGSGSGGVPAGLTLSRTPVIIHCRKNQINHKHKKTIGDKAMRVIKLSETNEFKPGVMNRFFLVETSEYFKIINFNLDAGVVFPVHSHDLDGELSIQVLEGKGWFLAANDEKIPAEKGDILISEIREPHGVEADTKMRILVTIAPPI